MIVFIIIIIKVCPYFLSYFVFMLILSLDLCLIFLDHSFYLYFREVVY